MMDPGSPERMRERVLARGRGWRASEIVCTAGPRDRPFEERHDTVSIAAVLAGSFTYRSAQGTELLAPGAFLLGNAGQCFTCGHEHAAGDRCIAVQYEPAAFAEIAAAVPGVRGTGFRRSRLPPSPAALRWSAALECTATPEGWEELAYDLAGRVLSALAEAPARAAPLAAREARRVTAAVREIERRHAEKLSLTELAEMAGLSPYHFLRGFRQVMGLTPYQYLLRTRLRHAAVRLRRSRDAVAAIAFDTGFGDLSTFNASFRRSFGMTPTGYRNAARF